VGKVYAVAEWMPNVVGAEALAFYANINSNACFDRF
jgi:hypothetical protein